jgi:hypothetical protein
MMHPKNSRDAIGQFSNTTEMIYWGFDRFNSSQIVTLYSVVAPRRKKAEKGEMELDIKQLRK